MMGEKNLERLIRGMAPRLHDDIYVFCTVQEPDSDLLSNVLAHFKEAEGTTLVLSKTQADSYSLAYDFEARWIELKIHSDLEAVGLTAAISKTLTTHGISCNVIAGYYHDHLFVPKERAEEALQSLLALTNDQ